MADPLDELEKALFTRLSGDVTLQGLAPGGVWNGKIPEDITSYPALGFNLSGPTDDYTLTGPYRFRFLATLRALDRGEDAGRVTDVLARVYALLEDATDIQLPMSGFAVLYCRRQGRTRQQPVLEGVVYQNAVDSWNVQTRPA